MTTIRGRLTLWYTVALGVSLVVFGTALYLERRRSSLEELDRRLAFESDFAVKFLIQSYTVLGPFVRDVTGATGGRPGVPPQRTLETSVSAYLEGRQDFLIVLDTSGAPLYLTDTTRTLSFGIIEELLALVDTARVDSLLGTTSAGSSPGPLRYLVAPVVGSDPEVRGVLVAAPTADVAFGPADLARSMVLVAPLILLGATGLGYWLAGRALQPLIPMREELEAITDGRSLHRRLPVPRSGDEMARLAVTINGTLARLERSFASLRRFTADASHELKTPLMVLRAGVERALTHDGTAPDTMADLDQSLEQINRMAEMLDSLLTLARADEGRMPVARVECDLVDIVAEVVETAEILAEPAEIKVRPAMPGGPVRLAADEVRLRQLLLNLVTNAIKYTPAGGEVALELTDDDATVTVTVRDTGIGIAPGDLPHVFDRFWRADQARTRTGNRPGVGLGLAISKWIAEAHGGRIELQSRPGRGTVVTVTLPRTHPLDEVPA